MKKTMVLIFALLLGFAFFPTQGLAQTQQGPGALTKLYVGGEAGILHTNLNGTNPQLLTEPISSYNRSKRNFKIDARGSKLYWMTTELPRKLRRANLNGTNPQTLIEDEIEDFTLDLGGRKLYWVRWGGIWRANLDGTNAETLVQANERFSNITLDLGSRKIYWVQSKWNANQEVHSIRRAALNGRSPETLVKIEENISRLTLDLTGRKMYWHQEKWGEAGKTSSIRRANLNGKEQQTIVLDAESFALDTASGKIYYGGDCCSSIGIRRANLNGTNPQTFIAGNYAIPHINLDVASGKMYWVEIRYNYGHSDISTIRRANLKGKRNAQNLFAVKGNITELALGPPSGPPIADVTADGKVNFRDIIAVGNNYGKTVGRGVNRRADLNNDGVVTIEDLLFVGRGVDVASGTSVNELEKLIDAVLAAPSAMSTLEPAEVPSLQFTVQDVQNWIRDAAQVNADPRAIAVLEQLLAALTQAKAAPKETVLLANYPNPFNPETWIAYHLAEPAAVKITIYTMDGKVVRTLALGHQVAGIYQSQSRAAYWDGRNALGEPVASGVYFYTLQAGDFSATKKMLIRK